jgi:Na+-transporting methylmalonyl-CoA/oxaloacetate decarboxylase beta subunit
MAVQFLSTVVVGVLSYLALLWLIKPRVLREVKYILEQSGNSIANRLAGKL